MSESSAPLTLCVSFLLIYCSFFSLHTLLHTHSMLIPIAGGITRRLRKRYLLTAALTPGITQASCHHHHRCLCLNGVRTIACTNVHTHTFQVPYCRIVCVCVCVVSLYLSLSLCMFVLYVCACFIIFLPPPLSPLPPRRTT